MNQNIVYVGLDVDDTEYHGSAVDKTTGEVIDFRCRPTLKGLLGQLDKLGISKGTRSAYVMKPLISAIRCNGMWRKQAINVMWSPQRVFPPPVANKSKPIASMRGNWRNSMPMAC